MSKIKELREKQARIVADARSRYETITDKTDESRAAELEKQHDDAMAEFDKIDAEIGRLERLEAAERSLEERMNRPDPRRPSGEPASQRGQDEGEAPDYRTAFNQWLSVRGDANEMTPEARAVLRSGHVEIEDRAQVTTTDTAGGFTVPTELQAIIVKTMKAWGPMYDPGVTSEINTSGGGEIQMPTVDDTASTADAHTEGATPLTDDGTKDVTFGQKVLNAYAYDTGWIRVSRELASDGVFGMEPLLGDLLGERLGRRANEQLTVGTGTGAPNGIVTASSLGKTAASGTAITWDEMIDLEHSVDPAYRNGPRVGYMFNDTTLSVLRKLKDGQNNYLWQAGDVQSGTPSLVNGRRYWINQDMANIAVNAKPVVFGDMGKYYVRKVGGVLLGALHQDRDFWPGFGVAGYIRFDGELADTAAVKHLVMAAV